MKVQVEELSPIDKKLVVEIAADEVNKSLEAQYKHLARTRKVRGFRPGKVPKQLVKRMFGAEAAATVGQELLQSCVVDALKEAELDPLDMKDVETEPVAEGQPFTFSIRCEVKPTFTLQGVAELDLERRETEPTDEDIARQLEQMREAHAELEPVEDRGADIGDTLTIDYSGKLVGEEEPFEGGTGTDHDVALGTGSLVPGFEDQLVGAVEGDERCVELTFPEDYVEHLAGKAAVFTVTVKAVRRKVLPDLDDDFAVDLEFEDLDALRASVYDRLSQKAQEAEDGRIRGEIVDTLIAANPLEVPPSLINQAAENLRRQLSYHLAMSGMQSEQLEQALGAQSGYIQQRAHELAHRDMLLAAVVQDYGLELSDAEVDDKIGELAENTGQPKARVRANLQGDRMDGLRKDLLQEKAFEWLEQRGLEGPVAEPETEPSPPSETEDQPEAAPEGVADEAEADIVDAALEAEAPVAPAEESAADDGENA